jgi:anti-sigma factor RsiW
MSAWENRTCEEMEQLLAERASGPLEAPELVALERHLEGCAPCRAAARRLQDLFSLVALPSPGPREEAVLRDLPERTLAAWGRRQGERRAVRAVVAVAGLMLAAAIPLVLWGTGSSIPPAVAVAGVDLAQLEWTESTPWDVEEPASVEEAAVLDALALEGEGAFLLGDSG